MSDMAFTTILRVRRGTLFARELVTCILTRCKLFERPDLVRHE